jgi:hypothetical protein
MVIATYRHEEKGRDPEQWKKIMELDTMIFTEVDPPDPLETFARLCREACLHHPPTPDDFNLDDISRYLNDGWNDALCDPDAVIHQDDPDHPCNPEHPSASTESPRNSRRRSSRKIKKTRRKRR